jgi:hypothetical protein
VSVVVVAHDMARELPRTLRTLVPPCQLGVDPDDYEILVVDNGSSPPIVVDASSEAEVSVRVLRIEDGAVSPARAANVGVEAARGDLVGLIVDGARMASPGLIAGARLGASVAARAVVTAPAWHLGTEVQHGEGDPEAEDRLLAGAPWESDGYALFRVAVPARSSARGLFGPMGESSSLFLARALWDDLGGLDERFVLPGGGMVNHDLYRRACELAGVQLVVLLGEGTFHQSHGGASTSGRVSSEAMRAEYEAIVGVPHRPPSNRPIYVGSVPTAYLPYLEQSVALAQPREVVRSPSAR